VANLLLIRKKIKSVRNTRKITKAMQLVAASKMRVFQKKAIHARMYSQELLNILRLNLADIKDTILTKTRKNGKKLFILYSSDKGLCGPLNSRMIKGLFNSKVWNELSVHERLLITVGKKSYDYANYNKINVEKHFKGLKEDMTPVDALAIIDEIMAYWKTEDVKEIIMVAPHYKSPLVFYPMLKTYLPFSEDMIHRHIAAEEIAEGKTDEDRTFRKEEFMLYEPSKEEFKESLIQQIIQTLFTQAFFELKAAEYSSRMIAMQSATDAADDMVDKLTLSLNKARQAIITQEIAEIVGGSAALN